MAEGPQTINDELENYKKENNQLLESYKKENNQLEEKIATMKDIINDLENDIAKCREYVSSIAKPVIKAWIELDS